MYNPNLLPRMDTFDIYNIYLLHYTSDIVNNEYIDYSHGIYIADMVYVKQRDEPYDFRDDIDDMDIDFDKDEDDDMLVDSDYDIIDNNNNNHNNNNNNIKKHKRNVIIKTSKPVFKKFRSKTYTNSRIQYNNAHNNNNPNTRLYNNKPTLFLPPLNNNYNNNNNNNNNINIPKITPPIRNIPRLQTLRSFKKSKPLNIDLKSFQHKSIINNKPLFNIKYNKKPNLNIQRYKNFDVNKAQLLQQKSFKLRAQYKNVSHKKKNIIKHKSYDIIEQRKILQETQTLLKQTNFKILNTKPSNPTFNPFILEPPKTPILDIYNYKSLNGTNLILEKQLSDPLLYPIIDLLTNNNRYLINTIPNYLFKYILTGRFFIDNDKLLKFKHGVFNFETNEPYNCIVLPSVLLSSVLRWAHGPLHHGIGKMKQLIQPLYWWPKYYNDIKLYCITCQPCQVSKKGINRKRYAGYMKLFSCNAPFQIVSIDIVGSLPLTISGYRYILTMIDKYSRFCFIQPLIDIRAITVIKAIEKFICIFGAPQVMVSDNGTQFISELYKAYTKGAKTEVRLVTPYYPQANGQIERLHRWIKERLALISYESGLNFVDGVDDWSEYLPIIQYTYNSSPNRMTNYSPSEIIFHYKLQPPLNPDYNIDDDNITHDEFLRFMNNRRDIIDINVKRKQSHYDEQRKKYYDDIQKYIKFDLNQLVYYDIHQQLVGNKKSLQPNWIGPFEIIKISEDGLNVTICDINNEEIKYKTNMIHIKPYNDRNKLMDLSPIDINLINLNYELKHLYDEDICAINNNIINLNKHKLVHTRKRFNYFMSI